VTDNRLEQRIVTKQLCVVAIRVSGENLKHLLPQDLLGRVGHK